METMKGKIIAIDGPDGTGKATTTKLLLELLNSRKPFGNTEFLTASFPDYSGFFGKQVRHYLDGDTAHDLVLVPAEVRNDPLLASWPYAADRYTTYQSIIQKIEEGNWFILDRYVQSNMAHQGAKIVNLNDRDRFCEKVEMLEHGYLGLPRADITVVLLLREDI